jgi:NADH-quinone oxidoreductase subunit N
MFAHFVAPSLFPAAPELFLTAAACLVLLIDLTVSGKRTLTFALTQLALFVCAGMTLLTSTGETTYTFSGLFVDDLLSDLLKLMLYLTVMVVLFYSRGYVLDRPAMAKGEFYVLALFSTLGMMVMISANHFLSLYLGLEMLSLSLYAMVAMNRDSALSTESAMKYFILGALASGMLLYGMSMLYGATGSLELTDIRRIVMLSMDQGNRIVFVFGLVFIIAGLAFKLGAVPFHMWVPDVYHGAPTAVTMFIGSAPKLAAFAMMFRLLVIGLLPTFADWQGMLMVLAVLSMAVGNLTAIVQTNIKRMLAYSAISHMGFMLLGMVSGIVGGDLSIAAYSSAMFYIVTYVMTSAAAFGVIVLLSRAGFEADTLDDFKGLNKRSPWFAFVMLMVMFSMAGVPFFVGFFAKFWVIQAALNAGYLWLALAAVAFSLIGAFFYLRVVKVMYFDVPLSEEPIVASFSLRSLLSANGIALGLFGLFPGKLMAICAVVLTHTLYTH